MKHSNKKTDENHQFFFYSFLLSTSPNIPPRLLTYTPDKKPNIIFKTIKPLLLDFAPLIERQALINTKNAITANNTPKIVTRSLPSSSEIFFLLKLSSTLVNNSSLLVEIKNATAHIANITRPIIDTTNAIIINTFLAVDM